MMQRGPWDELFHDAAKTLEVEANDTEKTDGKNESEVNESEVKEPNWKFKIPPQLVLTARESSLKQKSRAVQHNIRRTLNMSQDIRIRWLGDRDCLDYIKKHYDDEFATIFANELTGMYRGDLCRAAVLAKEGGFYTDLDVQLKVPLTSLVSEDTTFMSAYAHRGAGVLNAIMASAPGEYVVVQSIKRMIEMYKSGEKIHNLGPVALQVAIWDANVKVCPDIPSDSTSTRHWRCGSTVLRMLEEDAYPCLGPDSWSKEYCPPARTLAAFVSSGASYGLFDENKTLIGWSRMEECFSYGCESGGRAKSDHLKSMV